MSLWMENLKKVKAEMPSIVCNTMAAKEYGAEAERQIRTVKKEGAEELEPPYPSAQYRRG